MNVSMTVTFDDEDEILALAGPADENLRILEDSAEVEILLRSNELTLRGRPEDVSRARRILKSLSVLSRQGHVITADATRRAIKSVLVDNAEPDTPREAIVTYRGKNVSASTDGQQRYVDAIDNHHVVFGVGPAGTGKTYLAMAKAVQALNRREVSRIILTRPAVEAGEKLGFLPGSLSDKIDPYLRPLHDALREMVDPELIPRLIETGVIEVAPLAYMRGRTLNDSFVILDEAQNTTPAQMKMFLTRLGFGSSMVITGDLSQVDLPRHQTSGLHSALEVLADVEGISIIRLGSHDVVRHRLVSRIVDAYDTHDALHNDEDLP